jgi:diaminopimelate decarboxylase
MPKDVSEKDILVFLNCGAYGFAMSSQYDTRPRPVEILSDRTAIYTRVSNLSEYDDDNGVVPNSL